MKKIFLGILIFAIFGCREQPIGPAKITDIGVYFNEVQSTGGDWIEIYNSTASPVDLTGFKVYDDPLGKFVIPSGTIPANGFTFLFCDGTGVGGNTSFKLSSLGETLYFEDNKGVLIDKVAFPALTIGSSYARFPDGGNSWGITGLPSQNLTNTQAPTISPVSRAPIVPGLNSPVTVSATVTDISGVSSVKLFYRKDLNAFTSLSMSLSAGVYTATIPAAGSIGKMEYYIEAVNIQNVTTLYPAAAPAISLNYLLNTDPLPNYLFINEFMAFNSSCCPDQSSGINEFDDWIEIYNSSNSPVDIAGMYLSDDSANPFKFIIASTDPAATTIPPQGHLIVWADQQGSQGILHANFQLSNLGEEVGLYYIDGRQIDRYVFSMQRADISLGRTPDGGATWKLWPIPTPGAVNQ